MTAAVYEPTNLQALASALGERPEALLVAGGTQLMRSPARTSGDRAIVSLRRVEPLGRVSRSQRFLDIGATVPLSRVLSIGPRVVPEALFAALKATASPTVRVLATLGGNICAAGVEHTALIALAALDAVLELRLGSAVRAMPASLFWRGGDDRAIQPGEVLTRIRVPLEDLEFQHFVAEDLLWRGSVAKVSFAAAVGVRKGSVEEFRLCLASPWFGTLRLGDFESACAGVHLPMRDRAVEDVLSVLKRALVQRLGAPIPEVAPVLACVLRQTERILGLLSRGGLGPRPDRRMAPALERLRPGAQGA